MKYVKTFLLFLIFAALPIGVRAQSVDLDAFEREAVIRVGRECPQNFKAYQDDAMIRFRDCRLKSNAQCKVRDQRTDAHCNQLAYESCEQIINNFFESICGKVATKQTTSEKKPSETTEEQIVVCKESEHRVRTKDLKSCVCGELYALDKKTNVCVFSGARGINLSSDSAEALEALIDRLQPNEGDTVEMKMKNGKIVTMGIIRLPNGVYLFTPDGEHYQTTPRAALSPGLLKRIGISFGDLAKSFKGFFGVGKYGGPKSEKDGQLMTNAANEALKNLQGDADPSNKVDAAQELMEQWLNRNKNILSDEFEEQLLEEMKNATGVDVTLLKKILTGDIAGIGGDILQKVYTFPAQSVIILGGELRSASFANAVRLYARERVKKSPAEIMAVLQSDPSQLAELDFVTSIKGISPQFARGIVFLAYEEAYQRLLLAKKFK